MSYFRLPSRGNRFYADLSPYGGPTLKALIPEGERRATTDADIAMHLYDRWKRHFLDDRKRHALGLTRNIRLGDFARTFLGDRATTLDGVKVATLLTYAKDLDRTLLPYFGERTPLGQINRSRIRDYVLWRRRQISKKTGEGISLVTIRRELQVLSALLQYAVELELLPNNPARNAIGSVEAGEPLFLEPRQAWAVLEAAGPSRYRFAHALMALFLYTGLRLREALGLEGRDVDREAGVIHVRDNQFRSLVGGGIKYRASLRTVPLWPDLREWLPARIGHAPLFPSPGNDNKPHGARVSDLFAGIRKRSGLELPITPHTLRHTWCAMRLQTLDAGAPVAPFTVMKEGGWSSLAMVERIYGHLPAQRLRLPVLSYRPEIWERYGYDPSQVANE